MCFYTKLYIKKKKKSKSEGCFSIWAKIKIKRIEMGFFHSTIHTVASVSFRVITKLQTFGCLHKAKFDILLPDKNNFHLPISVIFFFFFKFFLSTEMFISLSSKCWFLFSLMIRFCLRSNSFCFGFLSFLFGAEFEFQIH